jgi:hypothetical protein
VGIDYSLFPIKKGPSEPYVKGFKRRAFDQALAKAYAEVNLRDANRSRATGRELFPSTTDKKSLREHNHIKGRNVAPEWVTDPARIFLVSTREHRYIHAGDLLFEGDDARKLLVFFWNPRKFGPGVRVPFKVLAKSLPPKVAA